MYSLYFLSKHRVQYKVFIENEKVLKIIVYSIVPVFKFKIFIDYYYCTCKSGKKQSGCCMHVASYIDYIIFSWYNNITKLPAEYLNSVLVDMEKQRSPRKPTYVRNKRLS